MPFTYVRPESVEHVVETLREHGDDAKVLAGGQSLLPALNMRLLRPGVLVDLNFTTGLDEVTEENGSLRIGALVRQAAAQRSELVRTSCPLLAEALPLVGHVVTRNRGTLCGSIAHADSAAELPLTLVALGGEIVTSRRTIPAAEFFVTHFTTTLDPDELVIAMFAQCFHRVVDRLCADVGERDRFHDSSSQTRAGVSGSSTSSTPSASATAFAIVTGALIVVPSPSPFAPSAVKGDGVSRCSILTDGVSAAVGQR